MRKPPQYYLRRLKDICQRVFPYEYFFCQVPFYLRYLFSTHTSKENIDNQKKAWLVKLNIKGCLLWEVAVTIHIASVVIKIHTKEIQYSVISTRSTNSVKTILFVRNRKKNPFGPIYFKKKIVVEVPQYLIITKV